MPVPAVLMLMVLHAAMFAVRDTCSHRDQCQARAILVKADLRWAAECQWDPVGLLRILHPTEIKVQGHRKLFTTARTCQTTRGQPTLSIRIRLLFPIHSNIVPVHGPTLDPSIRILKFHWDGEMPPCDGMTVNGT
jgi:hypothetical protein